MGWVQLGAGCVLMTMATRYLTAREIGLFTLLETTLGPIWVWLGIGERPTNTALVGGLIVITALLANGFLGRRGEKEL
jgi:drug/metabolite transporter (DMT)-like permease